MSFLGHLGLFGSSAGGGSVSAASITSAIGAGSHTGQPYVYDGSVIAAGTYIAFTGDSDITTGLIRCAKTQPIITALNSAETDYMTAVESSASEVFFGSNASFAKQFVNVRMFGSAGVYLGVGGTNYISLDSGGIQIAPGGGNVALHTNSASYGGGTGVLFQLNASVAPSSAPTGGTITYSSSGAVVVRGSGGAITTIAPAGTGTVQSQNFKLNKLAAVVQTGDATITTILSVPVPSGSTVTATIRGVARIVATGVSNSTGKTVTAKNVGGTTSQVGSTTAEWDHADASSGTWSLDVDDSSDSIRLRFTGILATVFDLQADADVSEN